MAQGVATGAAEGGRRRRFKSWQLLLALGLGAVVAGALLIVVPLVSVWNRGEADQTALKSWYSPPHKQTVNAAKASCGTASADDYALVSFNMAGAPHYAGVSGNGTWDLLHDRTMVHYQGTPDPGQQGNSIIAFHREPDYQHIDRLAPGDTVTIQDKACHTFTYKVTQRWDLPPEKVTQLAPTGGYDLTLVTCDPWWQDYDRLVWRATLVSPSGGFVSGGSSPAQGSTTGNPTF
jgi:LPXTG-site transpeptidase (sortase) family protein